MKKIKIICTLGPSSFKESILKQLKKEKIDIFRINLSHTDITEIEKKILFLKKNKIKNICIDTEGAQIRTTKTLNNKYILKKGDRIFLYNGNKKTTNKKIYLYPRFNFKRLKIGTKIYIGFNNLCLKVANNNLLNNFIGCIVAKNGVLESKKGVHINNNIKLPALTEKDIYALDLAKKHNIKYFALSFVNNEKDINEVTKIVGLNNFIISKIETKNALKNLKGIANKSSALLIDRGDLSRYVPIEEIPLAQEQIIKFTRKINKPTYVATNLLESMIVDSLPTRAESHDIYSTLKEGAQGLVLAAETAIGKSPVACVKFLKKCLNTHNKKKKFIK